MFSEPASFAPESCLDLCTYLGLTHEVFRVRCALSQCQLVSRGQLRPRLQPQKQLLLRSETESKVHGSREDEF